MKKNVNIEDTVTAKETIMIKQRSDFSVSHILAAAQFAKLSANIEKAYDGKWSDELFHEHRAYVIGSIVTAASFLEAKINELFTDTVDNPQAVKQLDPRVSALMASMWKLGVPRTARHSILRKFQIALTLAGKTPFDKGRGPYQDVDLLVGLRNALVHFEPQWVTTVSPEPDAVTIQKLEKKLSGKFPLNPLTGQGNPFFPDKCLGHGCADWAVTSCLKFADEFFSKMGMPPPYDHVRSRLKTK